jgi:hypothetical protein
MTARNVTAGQTIWRFAPDDPPPQRASAAQALMRARLRDEITGDAPDAAIAVSTEMRGLTPQATGAIAGLVGRPLENYGIGHVAGAPMAMAVMAEGFVPRSLAGPLPAQPNYPDQFAPLDLGDVALHRAPVSLSGRTVSHKHVVRAGAAVTVTGFWPTLASLLAAKSVPNVVALRQETYAPRPAAATKIAQQNLNFAPPAETKTLLLPAVAGDDSVRLSDQAGLAPGRIVIIDADDASRAEVATIKAIVDASAGNDEPATMVLDYPLRRDHRQRGTVRRGVPAAAGADNTLARDIAAGDVTLFAQAMAGLDATMTGIVLKTPGLAHEYHQATLYRAVSDANGYFRLPPIHRAAQIELTVTHGAEPNPLVRPVTLDWNASGIVLDLVFP